MKKEHLNQGIAGAVTLAMVLGQVPAPALAEALNEATSPTAQEQTTDDAVSGDASDASANADAAAPADANRDAANDADSDAVDTAAAAIDQQQDSSSDEAQLDDTTVSTDVAAEQSANNLIAVQATTPLRYYGGSVLKKGDVSDYVKNNVRDATSLRIAKAGTSDWEEITGWDVVIIKDQDSDLEPGSYSVQERKKTGGPWYNPTYKWFDCGSFSIQRYWTAKFGANGCSDGGVLIDGSAATSYDIDEGAAKTFTVKQVEDYDLVSVKNGDAELTPNEDGSYTIPSNADSNIVVTYKAATQAAVAVEGDEGLASVTIGGAEQDADGNITVNYKKPGSIVAAPKDGYAVTGVELVNDADGSTVEVGNATFANRVATVANVPALVKDGHYTLKVKTVKASLVLKQGATINVIKADKSEYDQIVFDALVDSSASVPAGISLNDVTIEYNAGGSKGWQQLGYEPDWIASLGGAHAFGAEDSESIRVTYKGSDQYPSVSAEQTVQIAAITLKLNDGAEVATRGRQSGDYKQIVFDAAFDAKDSIPDDLTVDDLEIKYLSYTAFGFDAWKDLDDEPSAAERAIGGHAFGEDGYDTETVQFTYKGKTATCTVRIVDGRYKTEMSINSNVSIEYNADAATMREELYNKLNPSVTYINDDGEVATVPGLSADSFEFDGLDLPADAGEHTGVTVKFKGTNSEGSQLGYQPCSTSDVTVTVTKAPAKVKVANTNLTYGETVSIADLVSSDPSVDETKPVTVIAGIDGDASGYLSIDLSYYSPEVQGFLNKYLHLDQGISMSGLLDILNNDVTMSTLKWALKNLAQVENPDQIIDALKTVLTSLQKYGLDNSTIALGGTPSKAGVYVVAAATTSGNYKTAVDLGYLTIAPKTADVSLEWAEELPHTALTYDEAQGFDFGVKAYDGDTDITDAANVHVTYAGVTTAGDAYLSSEAPTEPGTYTQTATVIGGNYFAKPISRFFAINRVETEVVLAGDDFTYNASPQRPTVTVFDSDGSLIDLSTLKFTYLYSGVTKGGKMYLSSEAPTEAGRYVVNVTCLGNSFYGSSSATKWFNIDKADAAISVDDDTVTYDGDPHGLTATATIADGAVDVSDQLVMHYNGNDEEPTDADSYEVVVTFPGNDNINPTAVKAELVIEKAAVTVSLDGDSVVYNGAEHQLKGTAAFGETDLSDQLTYTYNGTDVLPVDAGSYEVKASFLGNKNLEPASAAATLAIAQRQVAVSCGDYTIVSGDSDPAYVATVTDGADGQTPWAGANSIEDELAVSLGDTRDADAKDMPGIYDVTATTANGNFQIVDLAGDPTSVAGTLKVLNRVKVTAGEHGSVSVSGERQMAEDGVDYGASAGDALNLTATPESDAYEFKGWKVVSGDATVDDENAANAALTVGEKNTEVEAVFAAKPTQRVNVSVKDGEGGTAIADPSEAYAGQTVTVKATPADGYTFAGWEVRSGDVKLADASAAETTFVMGDSEVQLVAVFKKNASPVPAAPTTKPSNDGKQKPSDTKKDAETGMPETSDQSVNAAPIAALGATAVAAAALAAAERRRRRQN